MARRLIDNCPVHVSGGSFLGQPVIPTRIARTSDWMCVEYRNQFDRRQINWQWSVSRLREQGLPWPRIDVSLSAELQFPDHSGAPDPRKFRTVTAKLCAIELPSRGRKS